MKSLVSWMTGLTLCSGLAACAPGTEPSGVETSPEAIAALTNAQTRFVLPHVDHHSRLQELMGGRPLRSVAAKLEPVLAPRRAADLAVRDGRVVATATASLRASSGLVASDPVALEDVGSGMKVRVGLAESAPIPGELVDGYVVYRGAHVSGADVVHQVAATRHEDFLIFSAPPAERVVRYQLALDAGVAGLRLVDDVLELLDAAGTPRLRMQKPYTVDENGERTWATVDVEGCAVDRDGRAPFDRATTPPGAALCTVAVAWETTASPLLLDPVWTTTGSMVSAREGMGMVLLPNNRVLAAGGSDGVGILASAELFNSTTGVWTATTSMAKGRYGAEVVSPGANLTTLGDPIFIGGYFESTSESLATTSRVERYNSTAGTWTTFTALAAGRVGHSATLYATSAGAVTVMVAGGFNETSGILTTTERGTGTGAWTAGTYGGTTLRRTDHTTTRLSNGRLVMTGGFGGSSSDTTMNTSRLYNNALNSWGNTGNLVTARRNHSATLLLDGRILIAGGSGASSVLDSAEVYNATAGTFSTLASAMSFQRTGHKAVRLGDGTVLLAGGIDNDSNVLDSAEIFDPSGDEFFLFGDTASSPRLFHGQVLLNDGRVLLCGGYTTVKTPTPTKKCEYYDTTGD